MMYSYQRLYRNMMKISVFIVCSFFIVSQASAAMICGYNDTSGRLDGVSATCRATAQAGEWTSGGMNTSNYFGIKRIDFNCPDAFCQIQQGSAFCGAVAKIEGRVGTYSCNELSACASLPLDQSASLSGVTLCTGSQVCCSSKSATTDARSGTTGANSAGGTTVSIPDPLGGVTIPGLIGNIIKTFAGIAGSIALAVFVFGGFSYILSGGDAGKVKNASAMLRNGAIGIILIFGAYFFTATIINAVLIQNK